MLSRLASARSTTERSVLHERLVFGTIVLSAATYSVSQTLLIPSLPQVQRALGTSPAGATALVSAFFVSGAVSGGIVGRLGDMFGKRRALCGVLICFLVGAVVCAEAQTLVLLLLGRVLMGGALAIIPLAFAIARDVLPPPRVPQALAIVGGTVGLGAGVGLALGGPIADHLGYHWAFWSGAVFGGICLVAVTTFVPESPVRSPGRVDALGALLLAVGLSGPLIALSFTPDWGWLDPRTALLSATGAVFLVAFLKHELHHPAPLLNLSLLRTRQVALTNVATLLGGVGLFGATVIYSQYFQVPASTGYGLGASATQAGLYLVPGALLMLASAPLAGRTTARFGPRTTLLIGFAVATASIALMALARTSRVETLLWPTTTYIGTAFAYGAIPTLILSAVPHGSSGEATAVNQVLRGIGSSIGTQVAATSVTAAVGLSGLPAEIGYQRAFAVMALACAGAFAITASLHGPRRRAA